MDQSSPPKIPFGIYVLMVSAFFASLSQIGQITIIGKQVWDMTGNELDLGLIGIAEFLPVALLAPITGSIADRFDRRKVLAIALSGEVLISILLFSYIRNDPTSLKPIFALILLFSLFRSFAMPANRALPIDLAPPGTVERVVALKALSYMGGTIAGPIIFSFLFVADIALPYLVAAIGLTTGIALLSLVPKPPIIQYKPTGTRQVVKDAFEGLRFIRRTPILFGAVSLDLFAVLFGGIIALLPAIAEERLGVGAVGLGWLRASVGIGAGITMLSLSFKPLKRNVGRRLIQMVGIFGIATIAIAMTRSFTIALILIFIAASADAVSMFIRASLVPLATPEQMRGRVLAVESVFIGASNELGAAESGVTAAVFGLVGAILFGGAGTLLVVVLWWRLFPALRSVDRFEDVRAT
ncbi:MAG: MFS transporter [Acidimicrobiaceae bacterium]|nr:MFS transporter [Acidimicrobiaceae bacterium]